MKMSRVVVHVSGGVADIAYATMGAEVYILDFDNYREEEDMGDKNNSRACPHCKRDGSDFEWNAATIHDYGNDIVRIQNTENSNELYTCAFCFEDVEYSELMEEKA
jgi:hypothetical protein